MKEYVGIYIKTEKAREQDGFGNKMKYHFHITTVHKYRFFVFCLYSSCVYLPFAIEMYGRPFFSGPSLHREYYRTL